MSQEPSKPNYACKHWHGSGPEFCNDCLDVFKEGYQAALKSQPDEKCPKCHGPHVQDCGFGGATCMDCQWVGSKRETISSPSPAPPIAQDTMREPKCECGYGRDFCHNCGRSLAHVGDAQVINYPNFPCRYFVPHPYLSAHPTGQQEAALELIHALAEQFKVAEVMGVRVLTAIRNLKALSTPATQERD